MDIYKFGMIIPRMVQVALEELTEQNKVLLESKVLENNTGITTIIMKYGAKVDGLFGHSDLHSQNRSDYRSPSQVQRDNWRMQNWQFRRDYTKTFDSGVCSTPEQGPGGNGVFVNRQPSFTDPRGLFGNAEAQCTKCVETMDANTSFEAVNVKNAGTQYSLDEPTIQNVEVRTV